ncbi:[FeFe] hydrogenase H-cluster radical SAM maturase HydE [Desulfohalobiaceae bacterium Ax17]|uniref:[FeFe] hydrogenase H-cluster radical SAM maturase HydE n=1 Tax=Desulfovulcanus ferrireducens TaxID=2831190 RepID=UPI00207B9A99|nr:[FeFe] hydrogenase H-cluster radical SAM maturase HydE [Desulfovulcanus ferrireducens]MBT8764378.1 [FeFe] hydrogenase H-cluster radical SAM maturase HydE [Desulfovulcanus ferrireducens]
MNQRSEMTREEIISHLEQTPLNQLMQMADKVRQQHVGDDVHIRGIIEFSNYCCRSCLYCGLRKENKNIERYRMQPEEIIQLALDMAGQGVRTIVLQSGDDFAYSAKTIASIVREIKQEADVAITLSLGERDFAEFESWRKAGADRYLMKHETANPTLYARLHPEKNLEERLSALTFLRDLGYELGMGCMVGLPGQTIEDLAEDILLIHRFQADMAGIGPFLPQKDTPLKDHPPGDLNLTLKVLALVRLTSKDIHLPATTATATLDPEQGQTLALQAGANVIMPDFTPQDYGRKYIIYNNKAKVTFNLAKDLIEETGRRLGKGKGGSLKCKKPQRD